MTYTRSIRRARKSVDVSTLGNSSDLDSYDINETKKGRRHRIKKTNNRTRQGPEIASKSKRGQRLGLREVEKNNRQKMDLEGNFGAIKP